VLQYVSIVHVQDYAAARALGTPAAGLCPRTAREKGFPSNLLLDLIDIRLLSLYREDSLTPN
jgi:hypothetical protein